MNGLSGHISHVWRMMERANSDKKSYSSLKDLYQEVLEEMEAIKPKCKN